MPDVDVRRLAPDEPANWPQSLAQRAGFVALDSWSGFVAAVYGDPLYRLEARQAGKSSGLLVLHHIKHPFFGNYLTTAPFASYGGFAFSSDESRDALLAQAHGLASELGVDYAVVRFEQGQMPPPSGWVQQPIYSTYRLDLSPTPDDLMPTFSSDHRNHIRKSQRKGFSVRFGRLNVLDDAYQALAASMQELGSPYHDKKYLRAMSESLGETLELAVLYGASGELAGAGVFILQGEVATNLHANILRQFRPDYAGEFLYWSVIERYCRQGFKVFDMGRSLIGSGNEVFKMKWRPQKHLLAYWHDLKPGNELPALNQKNPKFRLAIWTWKRLPRFAVRLFGPSLIRGLA